uniref:Uncharacterized protein n=1 Tax=Anguilla anguilla TaxID=7936 RepID=A0A0E9X311_ANGAN
MFLNLRMCVIWSPLINEDATVKPYRESGGLIVCCSMLCSISMQTRLISNANTLDNYNCLYGFFCHSNCF